jgi:hypothetical protein
MSDITISTTKLMAMIASVVFAAGAAGAGVGSAVGVNVGGAASASVAAPATGHDREDLRKDREAFVKEVRSTLEAIKGQTGAGAIGIRDMRIAIMGALLAIDNSFMKGEPAVMERYRSEFRASAR